jgi:HTH-type transcriptional regulator/antitoxin HigA
MNIKPTRTKAKYHASLKEIESLMSAKLNTPEGDRLNVLTALVETAATRYNSALRSNYRASSIRR